MNSYGGNGDQKTEVEDQSKGNINLKTYLAWLVPHVEWLHDDLRGDLLWAQASQDADATSDLDTPELIFGDPRRVLRPHVCIHRGVPGCEREHAALDPCPKDVLSL